MIAFTSSRAKSRAVLSQRYSTNHMMEYSVMFDAEEIVITYHRHRSHFAQAAFPHPVPEAIYIPDTLYPVYKESHLAVLGDGPHFISGLLCNRTETIVKNLKLAVLTCLQKLQKRGILMLAPMINLWWEEQYSAPRKQPRVREPTRYEHAPLNITDIGHWQRVRR